MSSKNNVPNSFQTMNFYVDDVMRHISGNEFKVLLFMVRHIYGWQDKISSRMARISLSMIENGWVSEDGYVFGGVGLSRPAIINALSTLTDAKLIEKVGKPSPKGQMYKLPDDYNNDQLQTIEDERKATHQKQTRTARKSKLNNTDSGKLNNTSKDNNTGKDNNTDSGKLNNTDSGKLNNTQTNPTSNPTSNPTLSSDDDEEKNNLSSVTIPSIIKAWLDGTKSLDPNAYGNKTNRKIAEAIISAGLTPDDVTEFIHDTQQIKPKGFVVSFVYMRDGIMAWYEEKQTEREIEAYKRAQAEAQKKQADELEYLKTQDWFVRMADAKSSNV